MKKIFSILLLVALALLSLASCGKKVEDPTYATYIAAAEKIDSANSVSGIIKEDITVAYGDISITVNAEGKIDYIRKDDGIETLIDMQVSQDMGTASGTTDSVIYYADGYMYMEVFGQKIKMQLDADEFLAENDYNFSVDKYDDTAISDFAFTLADGKYTLTFTVDLSKTGATSSASAIINEFVDEGVSVTYEPATVKAVYDIETESLDSVETSFSCSAVQDGQELSIDGYISCVYTAIDTLTEITPPAGLDEYIEVE